MQPRRPHVRGVRAGLLACIVAMAALGTAVSADEDTEVVLREESFSTIGPVWIKIECLKVGCPGMELVVLTEGEEQSHEDSHLVEWSGWVNGNVSWRLIVDSGTEHSEVRIEVILSIMDLSLIHI